MNHMCRVLQRAQWVQGALLSAPRTLQSLTTIPCSSSSGSAMHFSSSSSSDDVTATAAGSSSSSKGPHAEPQPHQQQHASQSAFSTSPDAFTAHLQSKTEADVLSLLENARAARLAEAAAAAKAAATGDAGAAGAAADAEAEAEEDAAAEDDTADMVNPETGEVYGPRGKEPTRYGDWEIKGRATDFS